MSYSYRDGVGVFSPFYPQFNIVWRARLLALLAVPVLALFIFGSSYKLFASSANTQQPNHTASSSVVFLPDELDEAVKVFDKAGLQKVVDNWVASTGGEKGVVITDANGAVLASSGADTAFFTASIYKLYAAYIGYQQVDSGKLKLSDPYVGNFNLSQCLDMMVRVSDSPCAEKLMAALGRDFISTQLTRYGLKNTNINSLTTTAGDTAIILERLWQGSDLSEKSKASLLQSMKEQKYRDVIPAGLKGHTVYNKVGFRDHDEYHDVALVELADGRTATLSVLSNGTGDWSIRNLASAVSAAF